jgi:hypothetical protein
MSLIANNDRTFNCCVILNFSSRYLCSIEILKMKIRTKSDNKGISDPINANMYFLYIVELGKNKKLAVIGQYAISY